MACAVLFVAGLFYPIWLFPHWVCYSQPVRFSLPPGAPTNREAWTDFHASQSKTILELARQENSNLQKYLHLRPQKASAGFDLTFATYRADDYAEHLRKLIQAYYDHRIAVEENLPDTPAASVPRLPESPTDQPTDYTTFTAQSLGYQRRRLNEKEQRKLDLATRYNHLVAEYESLEYRIHHPEDPAYDDYLHNEKRIALSNDPKLSDLKSRRFSVQAQLDQLEITIGSTKTRGQWLLQVDNRDRLDRELAHIDASIVNRRKELTDGLEQLHWPTYQESLRQQRKLLEEQLATLREQINAYARDIRDVEKKIEQAESLLHARPVPGDQGTPLVTGTPDLVIPQIQPLEPLRRTHRLGLMHYCFLAAIALCGTAVGWIVSKPPPRPRSFANIPDSLLPRRQPPTTAATPSDEKTAAPPSIRPESGPPAQTPPAGQPSLPSTPGFSGEYVITSSTVGTENTMLSQEQTQNQGVVPEVIDTPTPPATPSSGSVESAPKKPPAHRTDHKKGKEKSTPAGKEQSVQPESPQAQDPTKIAAQETASQVQVQAVDSAPAEPPTPEGSFNPNAQAGRLDQCVPYAQRIIQLRENGSSPVILISALNENDASPRFAADLAILLQKQGLRVLLVEADQDSTTLAENVFKCSSVPGFLQWRRGESWLNKVTYNTHLQGVTFMPGGSVAPEQADSDLDLSREMHRWANLKPRFDIILLYCPTALISKPKQPQHIAAAHLRRFADGAFLLTSDKSPNKTEKRVSRNFSDLADHVLDVITLQ